MSPPEKCKERPGLQTLRGLEDVDGAGAVVKESNDTSEGKEETAMEVTTNFKKRSPGSRLHTSKLKVKCFKRFPIYGPRGSKVKVMEQDNDCWKPGREREGRI